MAREATPGTDLCHFFRRAFDSVLYFLIETPSVDEYDTLGT